MYKIPDKVVSLVKDSSGESGAVVLQEMEKFLQEIQKDSEMIKIDPKKLSSDTRTTGAWVMSMDGLEMRPGDSLDFTKIRQMDRSGIVQFATRIVLARIVSVFKDRTITVECPDEEFRRAAEAGMRQLLPSVISKLMDNALRTGVGVGEVEWANFSNYNLGISSDKGGKVFTLPRDVKPVPTQSVVAFRRDSKKKFNGFIQNPTMVLGNTQTNFSPFAILDKPVNLTRDTDLVEIDKENSLILTFQERNRNKWGVSLYDAMYPAWFWYQVILRSMVRYHERMGTPVTVVTAPSNKIVRKPGTTEDVDALELALQIAVQASKSNALALPSDVDPQSGNRLFEISYLVSTESAQPFIAALKEMGSMIFRAAFLVGDSIENSGGSLSKASVHEQTNTIHDQLTIGEITAHLNEHISPRIAKYNFGNDAPYVRIYVRSADAREIATVQSLFSISGNIPTTQEAMGRIDWIGMASQAGIPTITEEEFDRRKKKIEDEALERQKQQIQMQKDMSVGSDDEAIQADIKKGSKAEANDQKPDTPKPNPKKTQGEQLEERIHDLIQLGVQEAMIAEDELEFFDTDDDDFEDDDLDLDDDDFEDDDLDDFDDDDFDDDDFEDDDLDLEEGEDLVELFNPFRDKLGRFARGPGGKGGKANKALTKGRRKALRQVRSARAQAKRKFVRAGQGYKDAKTEYRKSRKAVKIARSNLREVTLRPLKKERRKVLREAKRYAKDRRRNVKIAKQDYKDARSEYKRQRSLYRKARKSLRGEYTQKDIEDILSEIRNPKLESDNKDEIQLFNPWHDRGSGRFTSGHRGGKGRGGGREAKGGKSLNSEIVKAKKRKGSVVKTTGSLLGIGALGAAALGAVALVALGNHPPENEGVSEEIEEGSEVVEPSDDREVSDIQADPDAIARKDQLFTQLSQNMLGIEEEIESLTENSLKGDPQKILGDLKNALEDMGVDVKEGITIDKDGFSLVMGNTIIPFLKGTYDPDTDTIKMSKDVFALMSSGNMLATSVALHELAHSAQETEDGGNIDYESTTVEGYEGFLKLAIEGQNELVTQMAMSRIMGEKTTDKDLRAHGGRLIELNAETMFINKLTEFMQESDVVPADLANNLPDIREKIDRSTTSPYDKAVKSYAALAAANEAKTGESKVDFVIQNHSNGLDALAYAEVLEDLFPHRASRFVVRQDDFYGIGETTKKYSWPPPEVIMGWIQEDYNIDPDQAYEEILEEALRQ